MKGTVALLAVAAGCGAQAAMMESAQAPSSLSSWKLKSSQVDKSHIELTFAVKISNTAELEDRLLKVSTPSSSQYGKLLTLEEVEALTKPSQQSLESVTNFLRMHGVEEGVSYSSGFLRAVVPLTVAEKMLTTKYNTFHHVRSGHEAVRCANYSLPDDVATHVDFVAPTVNFPQAMYVNSVSKVAETSQNTPHSLRELYGLGDALGGKSDARQG